MKVNLFEKLISKRTPFAVIQYFNSLKTNPDETNKVYEIMYTEKDKVPVIVNGKPLMDGKKVVTKIETVIKYKKFDTNTMTDFIHNFDQFNLVISNSYGKIYERGDFKKHIKDKVKEEYSKIK